MIWNTLQTLEVNRNIQNSALNSIETAAVVILVKTDSHHTVWGWAADVFCEHNEYEGREQRGQEETGRRRLICVQQTVITALLQTEIGNMDALKMAF